ncbi:MAG: hypothetical protein HPY74_06605 [Firmicutes bacterium]|nr:hypothetical protein [Bacillota bacterium]
MDIGTKLKNMIERLRNVDTNNPEEVKKTLIDSIKLFKKEVPKVERLERNAMRLKKLLDHLKETKGLKAWQKGVFR